jgi:hypothetical protein
MNDIPRSPETTASEPDRTQPLELQYTFDTFPDHFSDSTALEITTPDTDFLDFINNLPPLDPSDRDPLDIPNILSQDWIPYEPELVNAREWNPEIDERFRIQELFATMPIDSTPEDQDTSETSMNLEDLMNFTEETSSTPGILSPLPQSYAAVPAITAFEDQVVTLAPEPSPVPAITDQGLVRSQHSLVNTATVPATTVRELSPDTKEKPKRKYRVTPHNKPLYRCDTPGKVTKTLRRRRIPVLGDPEKIKAQVEDNRAREGGIVMNSNTVTQIVDQIEGIMAQGVWSVPNSKKKLHYLFYTTEWEDELYHYTPS